MGQPAVPFNRSIPVLLCSLEQDNAGHRQCDSNKLRISEPRFHTHNIYPMLPYADVLITDYSSILYDWLLMKDKDVILYLYDYDSYVKERDFYYPYMENVAGRIVNSFDQLCDCLSSGDYTMDPNKRDMIVAKFWGETARYDRPCRILRCC